MKAVCRPACMRILDADALQGLPASINAHRHLFRAMLFSMFEPQHIPLQCALHGPQHR